jgi:uncharacterized protein YegJ (DUF2314 family)
LTANPRTYRDVVLRLLRRDAPGLGLVYFRGASPPPLDVLRQRCGELGDAGMEPAVEPPPLEELLRFSAAVSDTERRAAAGAQSAVLVRVPARRAQVLADRKRLLRCLRAVLGDDGVIAVDLASTLPWSRQTLDDELAHEADLDVEALYCLHSVHEGNRADVTWLHTHGLAELGAFDLDVLRPGQELLANVGDTMRVFAYAVLEGEVKLSTPEFEFAAPRVKVRFVPAREFMEQAAAEHASLRASGGQAHTADRAVLCEPAGRRLFSRGERPEPARFFSRPPAEGVVLFFSDAATELMADRARRTLGVLRSLSEEFDELGLPTLVKLGYPRDDGDGREHLWFSAHQVGESSIDATLENQPHAVSRLPAGDRGRHPIELVTDWTILTPFGGITPRSLAAARQVRERRDEVGRVTRGG